MEGESGDDSCEDSPDSSSDSFIQLRFTPELNEDGKERYNQYMKTIKTTSDVMRKTNLKLQKSTEELEKISEDFSLPPIIKEYSKSIITLLLPFLETELKQFKPRILAMSGIFLGLKVYTVSYDKKRFNSTSRDTHNKVLNKCILKIKQYFLPENFRITSENLIESLSRSFNLSSGTLELAKRLSKEFEPTKSIIGNCLKIASWISSEELQWETVSEALSISKSTLISTFYKEFYPRGYKLENQKMKCN